MFLLFSAAGAARAMLESMKAGETRRLLAAPIQPAHMLGGSFLYMLVIQVVQCYVMYLFAWLVFDVKIWQITGGLFAITLCTALATIGFGLFIGAICRTAEQLDAVGTMVILAMSAIGGSMVPRHIMPDWMQKLGLLTINGWSFDGFMSVIAPDWASLSRCCVVLVAIGIATSALGSLILGRRLRANTL
jgi:ABC-2 type transport system permease protein